MTDDTFVAFLQQNDDEAERIARRSDVNAQESDDSVASDNANLKVCLQMYMDNVSRPSPSPLRG